MSRLASPVVFLSLSCAISLAADSPLAPRLLRTMQIAAPQGITVEQIETVVQNPNTTYLDLVLARSALLVLQRDNPQWERFENLLSSALNTTLTSGNEYPQPSDLNARFGGKEVVFTMVYALVMSGQQDRAVDILEQHLSNGSRYNQAVVLQALRNIGTQRALGLIQNYQEKGDYHNLAENTLVDQDWPLLSEIYQRWNLIPPSARTRNNLLKIIESGCGEPQAMAAYWLGFFSPDTDAAAEQAELSALKNLYERTDSQCDFMARLIAIKSLGLRSRETMDYWAGLLRKESDVQIRHQVLINAFAHYGRRFAPAALSVLDVEPSQYIQWQLMQGNIESREGQRFRSYWDMWIPVTLQFMLVFPDPGHNEKMSVADQNQLLDWFETGHRPKDHVVLNHMIYCLLSQTLGQKTQRLLTVFNSLPDRNKNWWILMPLEDRAALPLLHYYSTLPAPPDQARDQRQIQEQELASLIARLQSRGVEEKLTQCCDPTQECLRSLLAQEPREPEQPVTIHTELEARAWLKGTLVPKSAFRVVFSDPLDRVATVRRSGSPDQHWEYLYDCWRRTDASTSAQSNSTSPR